MESQINSLETRIEKMQERFNNPRSTWILVCAASSAPGPPGSWSTLPHPPQVHPDPGLRCSQSGGEEVSGEPCLQPHMEQMWEEGGCSIQLGLNCAQTAWDTGRGSEPANPGCGAALADADFSGLFTSGFCLKAMTQQLPLQELVQTTCHREGHQVAAQLRPRAHVAAAPTRAQVGGLKCHTGHRPCFL